MFRSCVLVNPANIKRVLDSAVFVCEKCHYFSDHDTCLTRSHTLITSHLLRIIYPWKQKIVKLKVVHFMYFD